MKKYKSLFFDVDDTLLDFGAAEKFALRLLFEEQNFALTSEVEENYKKINKGLWRSYEEGKINVDVVVNTRFSLLFKEYGLEVDGVGLEKNFRSYLGQGNQLVKGAFELVSDLTWDYDLYIVTNGVFETQHKRLRDSGLHSFFKDIFVSQEVGFQKPSKGFFDNVFAEVPDFAVEQGLVIGDSLSADIKGGNTAGVDTCWFNPELKVNHTPEIKPTYQIQRLEELYGILGSPAVKA